MTQYKLDYIVGFFLLGQAIRKLFHLQCLTLSEGTIPSLWSQISSTMYMRMFLKMITAIPLRYYTCLKSLNPENEEVFIPQGM